MPFRNSNPTSCLQIITSVPIYNSAKFSKTEAENQEKPHTQIFTSINYSFIIITKTYLFMAIRGASSISTTSKLLLQNYRLLKPLTTLTSTTTPPSTIISPETFTDKPTPTITTFGGSGSGSDSGSGSGSGSPLSFEDSKDLFASISTSKLLKSTLTLKMAAVEPVVDLGTWVINSKLMNVGVFKDVVMGFTKCTFYDHFVAGRNVDEAGETIKMLWDDGFRGMLDYGLEHVDDNESCDRNSEAFIKTVESTKSLPSTSVRFLPWITKIPLFLHTLAFFLFPVGVKSAYIL